jgi:hypothetical protein
MFVAWVWYGSSQASHAEGGRITGIRSWIGASLVSGGGDDRDSAQWLAFAVGATPLLPQPSEGDGFAVAAFEVGEKKAR